MVGPGFSEAMREFLHRLGTLGAPKNHTDRCRADAGHHPEKAFHLRGPPCRVPDLSWLDAGARSLDGLVENGYTSVMDSVRFGRVLGIGTRLAAKTVAS